MVIRLLLLLLIFFLLLPVFINSSITVVSQSVTDNTDKIFDRVHT